MRLVTFRSALGLLYPKVRTFALERTTLQILHALF
jgi:hypothetical protein